MSWRRLPACLPNLPIRLVPLSEPAQKAYEATGFVKQLVFKTVPSVGKVRRERERGRWESGRKKKRGGAARLGRPGGGGGGRRPPTTSLHLPSPFFPSRHLLSQLEIREYLRSVYNLDVASVRTLIAQGKKKRGKHGHYRRPDVKKAFVTLKGPQGAPPSPAP